MCGFLGAIGLSHRPEDDAAQQLLEPLIHRGPDDSGIYCSSGVFLGFRRLAILDLSERAHQPMVDAATGTALVFNGEIYNYRELRAKLEQRGRRFRSSGDTEVLLQGYLEWGDEVFPRCEGMWAAAVHDRSRGVVLVRDRFGEKPLFYSRGADNAWWFGSEPAALRAAGAGTGRFDRGRVFGFLGLGDIEDPEHSFFEGIDQVPAGALLVMTPTGPGEVRRWWRLEEAVADAWDRRAPEPDEILDAMDASVRLRLRSDVSVGTSLSGGLDSSGVVASLRKADASRELHAFTASFPGSTVDEWGYASAVAAHFGVTLHRVTPTSEGFLASIDDIVRHQGAPFDSPSVYAQWCVMQRAREEGVTVLLDGQGADEVWGGYLKYAGLMYCDLARRANAVAVWRSINAWRVHGKAPTVPIAQALALLAPSGRRSALARSATERTRRKSFGEALRHEVPTDPFGGVRVGGVLQRAATADLGRVLLPRLLRYADRNSMAWSREVRLPFLDTRMHALGLASDWSSGLQQGWTKLALRKAFARRLPEEIVWRRDKIAYQAPDVDWLGREPVACAIAAANDHLVDLGLLRGRRVASRYPWRVLTLSRFVRSEGLA